jgi:hypothetical protein
MLNGQHWTLDRVQHRDGSGRGCRPHTDPGAKNVGPRHAERRVHRSCRGKEPAKWTPRTRHLQLSAARRWLGLVTAKSSRKFLHHSVLFSVTNVLSAAEVYDHQMRNYTLAIWSLNRLKVKLSECLIF